MHGLLRDDANERVSRFFACVDIAGSGRPRRDSLSGACLILAFRRAIRRPPSLRLASRRSVGAVYLAILSAASRLPRTRG